MKVGQCIDNRKTTDQINSVVVAGAVRVNHNLSQTISEIICFDNRRQITDTENRFCHHKAK